MEAVKTFLFAILGYGLMFSALLFFFTFIVGSVTGTNIGNFADLSGKKESRLFALCMLLSVLTIVFLKFFI